jgi:hypothetical protein
VVDSFVPREGVAIAMRRLLVHSTAGRLIAVLGSLALALMLSCVLDSALRTDVRASAVQTAPAGQPIRISVVQPDNDLRGIALSLGNDAGRLYEFVRNEFVFEPIYGYLKGPWMTVLQGSGSACDLAALLVALLRLAGHEAQFVIGAAKIAASELDEWVPIAANWIGVPPDADSILRAFRRGRIASAQFQEDGIPYVSIDHVWVRAKIDGLWYELDPSFKQYRVLDGLDMAEAIGFDGHEFLVGSLSGAEIAENYVRNVGSNAIEAELSSLATLLSGFLRTEIPGEAVDAALGSRTIIPEPFDRSTTTLPYSTIIRNVSDTLPDDMVYRLRLEASGSVYEVALPDISGTRITLFPSTDGQSTLAVNGEAVGTITLGSEADDNSIGVAILEPNGEGYEREKTFSSETPYGIVVSVGTPTDSLLEERNAILRLAMASGHETHEESVLGELIHIMGLTWFSEKSRICSVITSPLSGVNYIPEYGVAFVTGSPAYGIDVKIDSRVFVSGPMAHRDTERALDVLEGIIASACEHAHIEQLLDIEAVSTIAGLCQASNEGLQLFRLTADNKDEVIPSLQYPTSRLERWEEGLETGDITSIILPERPVAVENWVGNAYVEQGPGGSSYKIGTLRGGLSLSGGDFGDLPARLSLRSSLAVSDCARGWTNIDEMSGRLLVASQDLQVAGLPPTSVGAFIRTYDSGSLKQDGLGYGWSHGWQSSLCSTSNWRRGLGNLSADEAAVLIVSSLASLSALDWRQDDAPIPVERWVIASIASNWALEQLTDNAIVISLPTGESATFLEHAGGFSCPSAHLNLEASPEREYALEDPLGNRFEFGPSGRLECWSDACH